MLTLWSVKKNRICDGITRRKMLQVGGLGFAGLSLPDLWRLRANDPASRRGRDLSCLVLWLNGGPSHLETFDPKPSAAAEIRGPYGTISTTVPNVRFGELLPMLSQHMNKCALIRTMTSIDIHEPFPMLTGTGRPGLGNNGPHRTSCGAVITRFLGTTQAMFPYINIGAPLGIGGGEFGPSFDPVNVETPRGISPALPQARLAGQITVDRLDQRRGLLQEVDRCRGELQSSNAIRGMDSFYQRAFDLLTSDRVRRAFDLSEEREELRARYGANHFGQSALMARRLVEAGARFVQINWTQESWDTHGAEGGLAGLALMEQALCPRLDRGLSALLEDLHQRGLLETTLVVVLGEFGRTPRVNRRGGRDHWPRCFSVFFSGGGIPGGTVVGTSDREAAYPLDHPVTPPDLLATIYRLMGINTNTDPRIRPFLFNGTPVADLV